MITPRVHPALTLAMLSCSTIAIPKGLFMPKGSSHWPKTASGLTLKPVMKLGLVAYIVNLCRKVTLV